MTQAEAGDGHTFAVSGSNLSGDTPFSVALRLADGTVDTVASAAGERRDLVAMCDELCRRHAVSPDRLSRLFVDVGPGSYTGLRVAVTFARFLHAFGGVELHAVQSLAVLARRGVAEALATARPHVRALLDARRGRYHSALFAVDGEVLVERQAPAALLCEEVLAALQSDEVIVAPAPLAESLAQAGHAAAAPRIVVARSVGAAELFDAPSQPAQIEDLEPKYLMASYAES